jgi:hypothetical protein
VLVKVLRRLSAAFVWAALVSAPLAAQAADKAGVRCETPPQALCSGAGCSAAVVAEPGNAIESKTGRRYFLDYPCDLKPGEKVVFILSLHGASLTANWQRHYFPAVDFKDKYRLVIATPMAVNSAVVAEGLPPMRLWEPDADDAYLHNIVDEVFAAFGRENIKSFWIAGHSQGGMTANRLICDDFFKSKADGWLSLSGGRIGPAQVPADFSPGKPVTSGPGALPAGGPHPGAAVTPACNFNYIFESGDKEIVALPDASPLADRLGCGPRVREPDIVDTQPGRISIGGADGRPSFGRNARPGSAEVFVYPNCKDGLLVADVLRLDKGHTEGLEPQVTEALVRMMVAAPGGKAQGG